MTPINKLTGRDQSALRRAVAAMKFERYEYGLFVPDLGLQVGGFFSVSVNDGPDEIAPNRVVNEGLNHLLGVVLGGSAQIASWYVALFSGNVTPQATWTAANFVAQATEFVNYDEATRRNFTPAAPASQSISNTASKAVFTASAGGGAVYGAAIISAPGKSAVTGTLFSAARFTTTPKNLDAADVLNVAYTVGASSS
jgi:hypothetical protein